MVLESSFEGNFLSTFILFWAIVRLVLEYLPPLQSLKEKMMQLSSHHRKLHEWGLWMAWAIVALDLVGH